MPFPNLDPIPLPAPVWLMKTLGLVTLALHFVAVMLLLGSLVMVIYLNITGRRQKNATQIEASYMLSRRMPAIMTWLINLGVPPLLFAQVLYGRALYTSSVLVGASWISVIVLVMAIYWLLYKGTDAIQSGKAGWIHASVALLLAVGVGRIYAMNMTLMLRPEVWATMYEKSPSGVLAPPFDPTITPRWMFVITGGLIFGGLWMQILSNMGHIAEELKTLFRKSGGQVLLVGVVLQAVFAVLAYQKQPENIQKLLGENMLHTVAAILFFATLALTLVISTLQMVGKKSNPILAGAGLVTGFLGATGAVIYRDGIRDITLRTKGFDVWQRTEVSNWGVIAVFLLLFVAALVAVLWLLSVMKRATPTEEKVLA